MAHHGRQRPDTHIGPAQGFSESAVGHIRFCRRQGLPDCRGAGTLVRRACRAGPVILAAKLIAGHGAEGERREPRPGRPDAAGARGRAPGWPGRRPSAWRPLGNPGPGKDTSPGSSSGPRLPQMASPRSVAVESAGAVQVAGAQEDAAAWSVRVSVPASR
jgi:hypothetical protein